MAYQLSEEYGWNPQLYNPPMQTAQDLYHLATYYHMTVAPQPHSIPAPRLPKIKTGKTAKTRTVKLPRTKSALRHSASTHHHANPAVTAYHRAVAQAEAAANIHKGSYSWFNNSGFGLKGDRVGINTGIIPPQPAAPIDYVTEGNVNDTAAFPDGQPAKIPKAKWPTQRTNTYSTGTGGFSFPTYTETPYFAGPHLIQRGSNWYYTTDPNPVSYHVTLSGGNETNKLLYGNNESLTYAELVDPQLHMKHPKKQRTGKSRSKHPRTKHPRAATGRTGLGHTSSLPTAFRATPPAPVPSRPLGHL